jgi:hypothetical protein
MLLIFVVAIFGFCQLEGIVSKLTIIFWMCQKCGKRKITIKIKITSAVE